MVAVAVGVPADRAGRTATIQGSVPGTVFVAVDNETNLEAGRATATGTPKSFSMVVPTGTSYRFYVMENEGTVNSRIYPMYMGTNNVFELDNTADGQTISLGMISPDMGTGKATPSNSPALMMSRGANAMVPVSLAGSAFSMENMKGTTWNYNTMMTSGTMGWEHGTLAFDINGLGNMTGIVRNGSSVAPRVNIPYTMSLSGMLLNPGDNTFQCVVSKDMTVMVATFTDGTGGPAMMIGQKRGGTFATDGSDMTGTWQFQRMTAGGDNNSSGWAFGTMQFIFGSASFSTMTTNTGVVGGGSFAFSMDANGIMTKTGDPSFYGVMSMDKSTIVGTDTNGGNPEMWVMMKIPPGTAFSTSDMMGDWVMHSVSSGNSGSRTWTYGHSVVDAGGVDTFTGMMGSGGSVPPRPDDVHDERRFDDHERHRRRNGWRMGGGMMGGGLVPATFHGTMNVAKNLMVSNYTDGTGGYPFSIQVK